MIDDRRDYIVLGLIAIMFFAGLYVYSSVPSKVPVHWNAAGEVDGYASKNFGLFLLPATALLVFLLFLVIPRIAVFQNNVGDFYMRHGFSFKLVMTLFFMLIYLFTIASSFGYVLNMNYLMVPAVSMLIFYVGYVIRDARRNFFIGIRTPWTLSSDTVWRKTHQLGGKLLMASAAVMLLGLVFPKYLLWFIMVPLLGSSAYLVLYSLVLYRREKKEKS